MGRRLCRARLQGGVPVRLVVRTRVHNNYRAVFARFDRQLFEALNPPFPPVRVLRFDGCAEGDEVHLELNFLFARTLWVSRVVEAGETDVECYFTDEGVKLPPMLKHWRHRHRIRRVAEGETEIVDDVEFQSLTPPLTAALYGPLYGQFLYRKPVYKRALRS